MRQHADGLRPNRTYASPNPEKETEMTPDSRSRRIVVGYDGSPASRAALAHAAGRAGDDGRIYVVYAYSLPMDWLGMPNYQHLLDLELKRAQGLIDRLEHESGADLQGVDWESEVIGGAPARTIANVASTRGADEIIVGTRGHGRARALLGSVAHEVIHLAECPVTVIPERAVVRAETLAKSGAAS
jgi:nucleotide-binding universal stress UspA family protein